MAHTMLFEFDTLTYANKLKAAGVPEQQADAYIELLLEVMTKYEIKDEARSFCTLKYFKKLVAVGVSKQEAEAHASIMYDVIKKKLIAKKEQCDD